MCNLSTIEIKTKKAKRQETLFRDAFLTSHLMLMYNEYNNYYCYDFY